MARVNSTINSAITRLIASLGLTLMLANNAALAQNPYDTGTPVEARGGASWFSAYAPDKLENVNLANGNFMTNIPLATVGARGSASYTVTLSHHSKLWTSRHQPEVVTDPLGGSTIIHHFKPDYGDGVQTLPNEITLGGGWFILKAPGIKIKNFGIDARRYLPNPGWYHYVLTKFWLVLPDGSEIELRDEATQGAPAQGLLPPNPPLTDRDRGRVWKSVDGSAITYINDTNVGGVSYTLSGWVFMPDGTRFRIDSSARCTKIIDRNGNYINIAYDTPTTGAVTYTDQLGRQVILQGGTGGATVTIKGYNGLADRVHTVETARIGALDGSGNPINMRSDYWSVQRPIIAGDYFQAYQGSIEHTYTGPHTDLFFHGEGGIVIDDIVTPTKLIMPDGRFFTFRYDKYASLAEIIYPGGGKTQIDYTGGPSDVCEILNSPFANDVNRRVTQRRILSNGTTVDAVWLYNIGSFEVRQGGSAGPLLMAETHYFLALNAEYRRCYSYGGDLLDYGSDGTMSPKWENAKMYKVERQTGGGLLTETKNWTQRAPVVWAPDPSSGTNAYAAQYGQEQPSNDDRVTREDNILENGKLKRVEYLYDNFNNVTSVKEYDFGTNPNPGPLVRETTRSYATNLNGSCYTNLNPTAPGCGGGIAADINSIIHLRRLPLQESIWDASSAEQARTIYEYDVHANDGDRADLFNYGSVTGHDAVWSASRTTRGNVTRTGNWLKASNTYLYAYPRYDKVGNVVAAKDPKGNVSSVSFTDDFGNGDNPGGGGGGNFGATYAFPTLFTSPPPNPGEPAHTARAQYDFSRGTQTGFKDRNNVIAKTEYNDPFNRPTKVIAAKGVAGVETHRSFYYAPAINVYGVNLTSNDVMVVSDRDGAGDALLRSWTLTDGFGRTIEDWTRHPQGDVKVSTIYDPLGRVKQASNPYRSAETPVYSTTTYDLAGRITAVTTPDGAIVSTAYDGARVMVTDQAQKRRISETDVLGRLRNVWEVKPSDSDTVSITFPESGGTTYHGYLTQYSYDALNNLSKVAQGSQRRWFAYDSLSRLIRARNPEQATYNFTFNPAQPTVTVTVGGESNSNWSMAYVYDPNGNLLKKKSATGPSGAPTELETSYLYDALNRNTQTAYSSYPNGSFYVDRFYDGATNGKGRFWYDIANNYRWEKPTDNLAYHHNKVNSYDALGRPLNHQQHFLVLEGGSWQYKPFSLSRTYDLAGNVKTQTYPSGRAVNYGYDTAGRLNSFTGNLGGGATVNYATGIQYNAYGLMSRETYGTQTPLYLNLHYNNRLQMVDLRLGSSSTDEWNWGRGALIFYYGTNAVNGWNPFANSTDNNGNVLRQVNYAPLSGGGSVVPQLDDYNYDSLNRVTSAGEQQQSQGGQWTSVFTQAFSYDRWGNRTINVGATTPSIPGVTRKTFVIDTATNRMTSSDGCTMTYDAAGNQTYDCVGTHSYDSENRMTKAVQGSSNNYYFYDANGKRVRRILNGSQTWGGQETWFVYGFDGELVAEYTYNQVSAPLPGSPQKEYGYRGGKMLVVWDGSQAGDDTLKWLVTDHLGSTRMEANKSGSLAGIRRHDYLPFGEELVASTGAQRSGVGYEPPASNVKQRFGSKERDNETGLDYFGARYYSSAQGRFTGPDIPLIDQYAGDPQSWNLYVYVRNNPLKLIDPTGQAAQDNSKELDCSNRTSTGACYNPKTEQYEVPGERSGGAPLVINVACDAVCQHQAKILINQLVSEVSSDIKPGISDVIPVAGGIKKVEKIATVINTARKARTIGRFGAKGAEKLRKAIKKLQQPGTHENIDGVIPTREEAENLLSEAGCKIKRIERGHTSGKGHPYDHINYETPSGEKGTIRVESVGRQYFAPGEGKFNNQE